MKSKLWEVLQILDRAYPDWVPYLDMIHAFPADDRHKIIMAIQRLCDEDIAEWSLYDGRHYQFRMSFYHARIMRGCVYAPFIKG